MSPHAPPQGVPLKETPREPDRQTDQSVSAVLPGGYATMEFVWIPAGTFLMGTTKFQEKLLRDRAMWVEGTGTGSCENEQPAHEVTISRGFYLGKYEITQGQWEAVMGVRPRYVRGPTHPAVGISWREVQDFIQRLNEDASEEAYRLPTEAEWEYACRAGTATLWSYGNGEAELRDYAWYGANVLRPRAQEVGTKLPNPWGLYDMHGNVSEWVHDWYDREFYSDSPSTDPLGPVTLRNHALRGGSYRSKPQETRSSSRSFAGPLYSPPSGARLVKTK